MNDKPVFIDTNVLIYAMDVDSRKKNSFFKKLSFGNERINGADYIDFDQRNIPEFTLS